MRSRRSRLLQLQVRRSALIEGAPAPFCGDQCTLHRSVQDWFAHPPQRQSRGFAAPRVRPTRLLAAACELRRTRAPACLLRSRFLSRACARNRAPFISSGVPFLRYPFAECAPRFPTPSASISGEGAPGSVQPFDYRRNTLTRCSVSGVGRNPSKTGFSHLPCFR